MIFDDFAAQDGSDNDPKLAQDHPKRPYARQLRTSMRMHTHAFFKGAKGGVKGVRCRFTPRPGEEGRGDQ